MLGADCAGRIVDLCHPVGRVAARPGLDRGETGRGRGGRGGEGDRANTLVLACGHTCAAKRQHGRAQVKRAVRRHRRTLANDLGVGRRLRRIDWLVDLWRRYIEGGHRWARLVPGEVDRKSRDYSQAQRHFQHRHHCDSADITLGVSCIGIGHDLLSSPIARYRVMSQYIITVRLDKPRSAPEETTHARVL